MRDLYPSRTPANLHEDFIPQPRRSFSKGYMVIKKFFDLVRLQTILEETPSENLVKIMEPDGQMLRSVFGVHSDKTSDCYDLCRHPLLLEVVHQCLGEPAYIHQSRINYKRGLGSTGWMWHSDFETWHVEDGMPDMNCLTVMIPLTRNDRDNGPLLVIPYSQDYYLALPGETPDNHYAASLVNQQVGVPSKEALLRMLELCGGEIHAIECEVGDIVLFDCNIMHASNSNVTPFDRTNLFFVYNAISNKLTAPFCGKAPRPEHVASRRHNYAGF